jgi:SAM-dependent methyltransferase
VPLMDFDKQETWEAMYRVHVDDGKWMHFHRDVRAQLLGHSPLQLRDNLKIELDKRILLVGAGFGFVAEDFVENGYKNVVACDSSKWIHAHKDRYAVLDIVDADPTRPHDRAALGSFDWCVTEDVVTCLTDDEAVALAQACRSLAPKVAHWTTACPHRHDLDEFKSRTAHPHFNWKKMVDWRALLAPDLVVPRSSHPGMDY